MDKPDSPEDSPLRCKVLAALDAAGGYLPFDRFMHMALYEPGLGYYSAAAPALGLMPADGSDFTTAPQMSPLFGAALARQVAQWLHGEGLADVWEFGAGTGALAEHVLDRLSLPDQGQASLAPRYHIVEVSQALRQRQQERLARFAPRVHWHSHWPTQMQGVVLGNEVLDAMPVKLLLWDGHQYQERGVARAPGLAGQGDAALLAYAHRPTPLRPPVEQAWPEGTVLELHQQAQAFVRSLGERLVRGAALFIDYGFPEREYYHPQRSMGTLVCHRSHQVVVDELAPLRSLGLQDISAHVDFTGVALAAQEAGMAVVGYTSQARLLLNCGILQLLQDETACAGLKERAAVQKLLAEHEMGELFKALALVRGLSAAASQPLGFTQGDRTHTL